MRDLVLMVAGVVIGFAGVFVFTMPDRGSSMLSTALAGLGQNCPIKGNVSTKGERIYHVPGQQYYNDTVIQSSHGERWFCSVAKAVAREIISRAEDRWRNEDRRLRWRGLAQMELTSSSLVCCALSRALQLAYEQIARALNPLKIV